MMQVGNTTDLATRPKFGEMADRLFNIFVPVEALAIAGRAIGLFVIAVGTIFGGGLVTAQATRDAAPGNSLYEAKLAVEKVQLALAPNEDYRTRLHTDFADRRMDEIARLAEAPTTEQKQVATVVEGFGREVIALKDGLEKLRVADEPGVSETAKLLERKMAVYQNVLRKAGETLPPSAHASLSSARELVDGVTISAMAVLVEKNLAGDVNAPRSVVASKFENRLEQAEAKLQVAEAKDGETAAPKAKQAKAAIAAAKELVKNQDYQAALTKIVEVAQLTKEVEDAADKNSSGRACPCTTDDKNCACPDPTKDEPTTETPAPTKPADPVPDGTGSEGPVGSGNR